MFTAHASQVSNYMRRRVSNVSDIEDLISEVFLVAARKIDTVPLGKELPWLYATSRNLLANWRRRNINVPIGNLFPDIPYSDSTERLELVEAWEKLDETDKEFLLLAVWEGLSTEELAEVLQMTPGSAASALSRARKRFSGEINLDNE